MANRVISAVLSLRDRDFASNLRRASEQTTDFGRGITSVGNGINRFGQSATTAFRNVAIGVAGLATAGITGLGAAVTGSVTEMDSAFSQLEAKTGITGTELEGLKSKAKEVFVNGFGESILQVTNDLAILKQNLGTVDAKTLESSQILAKLSENADIDSVSRALRSMTSSFPGATQQQSLDLITKTLQIGGDSSGDLLDTFNEYSGVVSAAGIGMKNFGNILVNGAKSGARNYDVVADTLKEFNILSKTGSKETRAAFKDLGMDADKVAADLTAGGKRGEQAYYNTMKALSKLDDKSKYSTGVALMGTKFEDLEVKTIEAMGTGVDRLGNFEGATKKAGDALQNNFGTKMLKVWREMKIGLSDAFNENGGQKLLSGIATKAEELVPKVKALVGAGIEFGNTIRDNWGPIKETVIGIGAAIGTFGVIMLGLKVVQGVTFLIQGFRTALTLATAGQWAMNTALLASPLTWVAIGIAAVVAAGVLLYRNWDTVKEKAGELWATVKEKFAGVKSAATEFISPVTDMFQGLQDKWDGFKSSVSNFKMPKIGMPKWAGGKGLVQGSFAVGTNRVEKDMVAQIHKDEMIIPARQSERLRQQGVNIDNIDKSVNQQGNQSAASPGPTNNTNTSSSKEVIVYLNVEAKGVTAKEVINEFVPELKLAIANM